MKKSNIEQHVVLLSGFNRVDGRYSATLTACLKINQSNPKSFFKKKWIAYRVIVYKTKYIERRLQVLLHFIFKRFI